MCGTQQRARDSKRPCNDNLCMTERPFCFSKLVQRLALIRATVLSDKQCSNNVQGIFIFGLPAAHLEFAASFAGAAPSSL